MADTFKPQGGTRAAFNELFEKLGTAYQAANYALNLCAAIEAEMHGRYTPLTSYAALEERVTDLENAGGSYSETELLAAPIIGNSASGISPIPLLDSIDNYDQLVFRYGIFDGQDEQCFVQTILCSDLTNNIVSSLVGYPNPDYNLVYGIKRNTSTSLTVTNVVKNGWPQSATVFSIKGVKF